MKIMVVFVIFRPLEEEGFLIRGLRHWPCNAPAWPHEYRAPAGNSTGAGKCCAEIAYVHLLSEEGCNEVPPVRYFISVQIRKPCRIMFLTQKTQWVVLMIMLGQRKWKPPAMLRF